MSGAIIWFFSPSFQSLFSAFNEEKILNKV